MLIICMYSCWRCEGVVLISCGWALFFLQNQHRRNAFGGGDDDCIHFFQPNGHSGGNTQGGNPWYSLVWGRGEILCILSWIRLGPVDLFFLLFVRGGTREAEPSVLLCFTTQPTYRMNSLFFLFLFFFRVILFPRQTGGSFMGGGKEQKNECSIYSYLVDPASSHMLV